MKTIRTKRWEGIIRCRFKAMMPFCWKVQSSRLPLKEASTLKWHKKEASLASKKNISTHIEHTITMTRICDTCRVKWSQWSKKMGKERQGKLVLTMEALDVEAQGDYKDPRMDELRQCCGDLDGY